MSHFAKLDENNLVTFVTVGRQEDDGLEEELNARTNDVYRQTSYNTHGGIHYTDGEPSADQTKALRFNYAGIGFSMMLTAMLSSRHNHLNHGYSMRTPAYGWHLSPTPAEGAHTWDEETGDWVEVTDENS